MAVNATHAETKTLWMMRQFIRVERAIGYTFTVFGAGEGLNTLLRGSADKFQLGVETIVLLAGATFLWQARQHSKDLKLRIDGFIDDYHPVSQ